MFLFLTVSLWVPDLNASAGTINLPIISPRESVSKIVPHGVDLVTNDSSPLHIAGAFDNWIVTVPTCKHPEHILPFRNGTQSYKTKVLYKKLLLDDLEIRHTESHTDTIDTIPEGNTLWDYIPEVDKLVKEVFETYEKQA